MSIRTPPFPAGTRHGLGNRGSGFDVIGQIAIELLDQTDRDQTIKEILQAIRDRTAGLAGIVVEARAMNQGPPVGKPIEIEFASHEKSLLEPAVGRVLAHIERNVTGLRDIDDNPLSARCRMAIVGGPGAGGIVRHRCVPKWAWWCNW